jgi:hypothetical protein
MAVAAFALAVGNCFAADFRVFYLVRDKKWRAW